MKNAGSAEVQCSKNSDQSNEAEEKVSFVFCLYFDGTKNNRKNTQKRISTKDWKAPKWYSTKNVDKASYENDFSNISHMEKLTDDIDKFHQSIYIEGIGTLDEQLDDLVGSAWGNGGATGVKAKVTKALKSVVTYMKSNRGGKVIEEVTLNTFGFSRGAAAARYCIDQALTDKKTELIGTLKREGVTLEKITINFVGLFDTVASYGSSEEDDTEQLKLDAIKDAKRTFQLAASEEYRKKFPLTDLKSAHGKGKQVFLPGAHSDVGGGYRDGAKDDELQIFDVDGTSWDKTKELITRERKWFKKRGWYLDDKLTDSTWTGEVWGSRASISNVYNKIPLDIMITETKDHDILFKSELHLDEVFLSDKHPILKEWKKDLVSYVNASGFNTSTPERWFGTSPELKKLRHGYLHFSAVYGTIGMAPRWEKDILTGERKRLIIDG